MLDDNLQVRFFLKRDNETLQWSQILLFSGEIDLGEIQNTDVFGESVPKLEELREKALTVLTEKINDSVSHDGFCGIKRREQKEISWSVICNSCHHDWVITKKGYEFGYEECPVCGSKELSAREVEDGE